MKNVLDRMTPNRLALLRELEGAEWADAMAANGAHSACFRLGWTEPCYRLTDGRVLPYSQFEAERPMGDPGNRWLDVEEVVGVALTAEGREAIRKFERDQKTKARDWLFVNRTGRAAVNGEDH